jgi:transcriptional antiterminator Rof (Rho-off)
MGHAAKIPENRCNVLDEIEAAITLNRDVRVFLQDGSRRSGSPQDLYTENHEDFLKLENHLPIPVSHILRVEKM